MWIKSARKLKNKKRSLALLQELQSIAKITFGVSKEERQAASMKLSKRQLTLQQLYNRVAI